MLDPWCKKVHILYIECKSTLTTPTLYACMHTHANKCLTLRLLDAVGKC